MFEKSRIILAVYVLIKHEIVFVKHVFLKLKYLVQFINLRLYLLLTTIFFLRRKVFLISRFYNCKSQNKLTVVKESGLKDDSGHNWERQRKQM